MNAKKTKLLATSIFCLTISCADTEFLRHNPSVQSDMNNDVIGASFEPQYLTIKPALKIEPIDIVWFIDSSSSMKDEVKNVSKNLERFVNSVSANTEIKINIVYEYKSSKGTKLEIPKNVKDKIRIIPKYVASREIFEMIKYVLDKKKFRDGVKKSIIIVTDDDDEDSSKDIRNYLDEKIGLNNVKVFSFASASNDKGSCEGVKKGEEYKKLAQKTGGEFFDICERDWSGYFDKLIESNMETTIKTTYALRGKESQITKILIDGQELDESNYDTQGTSIEFKPESLQGRKSIEIHYSN